MTEADNRTRPRIRVGAGILVLVVVAAVATLWSTSQTAVTPRVIEGWAMPNAAGTAISLHDSADGAVNPGEGFVVAGADWAGPDGAWHGGGELPTCVGTDTNSFTHVRLGIVTVETGDGGVGSHVVWLNCLE